jgi:formylglycine-generating enzyme required for sulfatase activity
MKRCFALYALGAAVLATGCAPTRIGLRSDFWQERQIRVGVALAARPVAGTHKVGSQGLLDMAINAGMAADLNAHLQTLDVSDFEKIRDRFATELSNRGMNVVVLTGAVDPDKYPPRAEEAPKIENAYVRDLTALRTEQKLDAILLLQVRRYGTIRSYYGFIPLGAPSGFFEAKGQLIDLRTGAMLWQAQMTEQQATVPAMGEWDQPPAYPNLTAAIRVAISNGSQFLWNAFFTPEGAPSVPSPVQAAPVETAPPVQAAPLQAAPVMAAAFARAAGPAEQREVVTTEATPARREVALVTLAGGTFRSAERVGGNALNANAAYAYQSVGRFAIDATEVTVAEYSECVRAGACTAAEVTVKWQGITENDRATWSPLCNGARAARADHPMNCVDWNQARSYCTWKGKRLPSEAEFEWAARRGNQAAVYPWGNAPPAAQLCWNGERNDAGAGKRSGTCAVGSFPAGDTADGVKDLAGNVWEWTDTDETRARVVGKVVRGGGWLTNDPQSVTAGVRQVDEKGRRGVDLGFRCANDL